MEKNKNISSEALEGVEKHVKPEEEGDDDDEDDEKFDDENEQVQLGELVSSITPVIATDSKVIELETLAVPENDIQSGFITSSHHLSEVPVEHTLQPHESAGIKSQVRVSQQQALVSVMTQTDQLHLLNHLQLPGCQTSALELSPTSVTQSILFVPSPTLQEQRVSPLANSNGMFVAEVNQKKFSDSKIVSAAPVVKASSVDGYNWRKYGQKQVKSPQGFRSYYKCTYSECYAKKIECCDSSSSVTEIIYKSHHNHDPPPKINCATEKRLALSVVPIVGSTNTSNPVGTLSSKDPATSSGESIEKKIPITKTKQQFSSGTDGNDQMNDAEEHVNKPESKRRVKKSSSVYTDPVCTSSKKPKFVVHAAGDVGISGDGYRWRKYGQKVVKGTPHPRNYYRCTSAGCPVRKHTEMATDNTSALIITYKEVHDHDMPVPKKRHGPPSAPLLAAAAPASMNNLKIKKSEAHQNEQSATQWSVDKKGELTG